MKELIFSITLCVFVCSNLFAQNFTIIGLPDTQNYTGRLNGGTPEIFKAQTQWIADNMDSLNIVYVTHLGDCVQLGDNEGNDIEWVEADAAIRILEDPQLMGLQDGIPYGIAVGNHDQSPFADADGTTTFYNQFFGVERFSGREYYGGNFGQNNDNHFDFFSASGLDFIVIYLEYDLTPDEDVLNWAEGLLETYYDKRAIIVSHHILDLGEHAPFGVQGEAIYEKLKDNPNLFLMLCGHLHVGENRREDTFNGNTIYSIMSNYQVRENGGNGWLRIMEFSLPDNEIRVSTYSPTLDSSETDSNSQFTLPYNMQTPTLVEEGDLVPKLIALYQNYPNPFNPGTVIGYQLSTHSNVVLTIYNQLGQKIQTLVNSNQTSGQYRVDWDGRNAFGNKVSSGIYWYHLRAGAFSETRHMILLR